MREEKKLVDTLGEELIEVMLPVFKKHNVIMFVLALRDKENAIFLNNDAYDDTKLSSDEVYGYYEDLVDVTMRGIKKQIEERRK